MKELDIKPGVVEVQLQQAEKRFGYKSSIRHTPGHILWQFHVPTGNLSRAEIQREVAIKLKQGKTQKMAANRVMEKPDCIYFEALNERNAWRKLAQILRKLKGGVR